MIRVLVRLGAWLDKRFPEKVVVTQANYETLKRDFAELFDSHRSFRAALSVSEQSTETRIAAIESQVAAIRDTIIKSGLREPTETERLDTLDAFAEALLEIAREAHETPDLVLSAPHSAPVRRLDEATAARQPNLRWRPEVSPAPGPR